MLLANHPVKDMARNLLMAFKNARLFFLQRQTADGSVCLYLSVSAAACL